MKRLFLFFCLTVSTVWGASFAYVVNQDDNNVSVIDTATNIVVDTVAVGFTPTDVAITPDGSKAYVVNAGGGTVSVINTANNSVITTIGVGPVLHAIAISPDGSRAYVTSDAGFIEIIDTTTNTLLPPPNIGIPPGIITDIAITPDGSKAYVTDALNNILIDVNITSIPPGVIILAPPIIPLNEPVSLAISPDGSKAYVLNRGDNSISIIHTVDNTPAVPISTIVLGPPVPISTAMAITPDGSRLYVTQEDIVGVTPPPTVLVVDIINYVIIDGAPFLGDLPSAIAITSDGSKAYITDRNNSAVLDYGISAIPTQLPIAPIPVGSTPTAIAITPDISPAALSPAVIMYLLN